MIKSQIRDLEAVYGGAVSIMEVLGFLKFLLILEGHGGALHYRLTLKA